MHVPIWGCGHDCRDSDCTGCKVVGWQGSEPEKRPMSTAPKDGRAVILGAEHVGEVAMVWSSRCRNDVFAPGVIGMWETVGGSYTWAEAHDVGPEWWRPIPGMGVTA